MEVSRAGRKQGHLPSEEPSRPAASTAVAAQGSDSSGQSPGDSFRHHPWTSQPFPTDTGSPHSTGNRSACWGGGGKGRETLHSLGGNMVFFPWFSQSFHVCECLTQVSWVGKFKIVPHLTISVASEDVPKRTVQSLGEMVVVCYINLGKNMVPFFWRGHLVL